MQSALPAKKQYYRYALRAFGLLASAGLLLVAFVGPTVGFFRTVGVVYYGIGIAVPLLVCAVVALHVVVSREFGRLDAAALAVAAVPFGTYVYATHIEPRNLQVRRLTIDEEAVDGELRVLHISDIQAARIGAHERYAFEQMRHLDPDLVVHTGDLLQPPTPPKRRRLANLFRTLDPPHGVYHVVGDTDVGWTDREWRDFDRAADITILRDETVDIETDVGHLRLAGLNLTSSRNLQSDALRNTLRGIDPSADRTHILAGHAPDFALAVRRTDADVDLALAGHTHGGQIRLPWFGPILTLTEVPRDWARGHTEVGPTHLNVSAGIGAEHRHNLPSIRFNCPPEMTLLTLR
jgi:predicted MPP superfamily phosphohydrolase